MQTPNGNNRDILTFFKLAMLIVKFLHVNSAVHNFDFVAWTPPSNQLLFHVAGRNRELIANSEQLRQLSMIGFIPISLSRQIKSVE
ncbi:hypothetical protein D3C73_1153600 [compost metagenome]